MPQIHKNTALPHMQKFCFDQITLLPTVTDSQHDSSYSHCLIHSYSQLHTTKLLTGLHAVDMHLIITKSGLFSLAITAWTTKNFMQLKLELHAAKINESNEIARRKSTHLIENRFYLPEAWWFHWVFLHFKHMNSSLLCTGVKCNTLLLRSIPVSKHTISSSVNILIRSQC